MLRRMTLMLILAVSLLNSRAASAQEKGQTGLTMGYPASVGLVWQPSGSFALRPEFAFATTSNDDSFLTSQRHTTSLGVGLSGLFYVGRWESLSTYVSPRFVYSRFSSGPDVGSESNTYSLTGSFGTQYAMNRRFGVFGEVGFGYSHGNQEFSGRSTLTTDSWSTRTGIGVLVYF